MSHNFKFLDEGDELQIIVEGWRFTHHSYSVVNQFQMLELLDRPEVELFHRDRDLPHIDPPSQTNSLFDRPIQRLLNTIPSPSPNQLADVTLRIYSPWNFAASTSAQTWVFAATEWGIITNLLLEAIGVNSITETPINSESKIITPSAWSKAGLIRSGVPCDRIAIVPHGADTDIYYPPSDQQRQTLRKTFGWEDYFIFLNIGGQTDRKGIRPLLKAFAAVVDKYPHARLVLKGSELFYSSRDEIAEASQVVLSDAEKAKVLPRLIYGGNQLSFAQIAELYQAADAYVSPYLAEGFNLPVLEAAACGLPVICTAGGPTDDFTNPDFALTIESKFRTLEVEGENLFILDPDWKHLIQLMQTLIEQPAFTAKARLAGPRFVSENFTWKHAVDKLLDVMIGDGLSVTNHKK